MELSTQSDGTWQLRRINALERLMLQRIPDAADPTGIPDAERRLFPDSPLGMPALRDEDEQIADDWREFVEPELRAQFRRAVDVVRDDLTRFHHKRRSGDAYHSLSVPKAHADAWCSALNQARLVLHEHHRFPDDDADPDNPDNPDDEDSDTGGEVGESQWMAALQSEIYGGLLEFLVTRVLWLK